MSPFRKGRSHAASGTNLNYHGGTADGSSTVGVETAPKVYLVFWGSQWSSDPSGEAAILQNFLSGVGGSSWNNTVVQYCEGVPSGTVSCNGAGTPAGNPTGVLAGSWYDSSRLPKHISQSALATEAVNAAGHFGNKTAASNVTTQYVIATPTGHNASGFGSQYCAYHSSASSTFGLVAYTNLPYITDAGANCGANFNGLGADAGITIVEGHEYAETVTDQFPNGGWLDNSGSEIGDKCAWIASGQGASQDITLPTGTFAVQSLWSNAFNNGGGGCVVTYP
jgi:serine protease